MSIYFIRTEGMKMEELEKLENHLFNNGFRWAYREEKCSILNDVISGESEILDNWLINTETKKITQSTTDRKNAVKIGWKELHFISSNRGNVSSNHGNLLLEVVYKIPAFSQVLH